MTSTPHDLEALLAQAGWARSLARSLVRDPDRADDLVQRAWLAALRDPPAESTPPRRWLATVMRNFARDDARESSSRERREREVARSECAPAVDPFEDAAAAQARLLAAVRELSEPSRSAVWARYYEGLAPRDIAARDGVSVGTVKTRIARGLESLRERFDREHGGDRDAWIAAFAPLAFAPIPAATPPTVATDPSLAGPLTSTTLTTLAMDAKLKIAAVLALVVCGSGIWLAVRDGDVEPSAPGVEPAPALALADPESVTGPGNDVESAAARAPAGESEASPAASVAAAPLVERRGLVVDLEERPVAGLAILRDGGEPIVDGGRAVTTDARGRFVIRDAAGVGIVAAGGAGWTTQYSAWRDAPDGAGEIVVVVARERRIRGSVVDAAGAPVADAVVEHAVVESVRRGLGELLRTPVEMAFTTRTDAAGNFELVAPDAEARLTARAENHRPGSQAVSGGALDDVVIVLPAPEPSAITLRGRVVDARGAGVERALVALASVTVRTGADGEYALSVTRDALAAEQVTTRDGKPPAGPMPLVLRAVKRGHLPAERRLPEIDDLERTAPHETWRLELGGPPLAIEGRIVGSDGRPIERADVFLIDTQFFGAVEVGIGNASSVSEQSIEQYLAGADIYQPRYVTGADGAFRFEGLQDREYRVDVGMHDIPATGTSAPIRAGAKGVDVVLDTSGPRADLAGRVVDRRGEPVAGARVYVAVTRPDSEDFIGGPSQETDAAGRFAFQRVRGSQFMIQVGLAGIIAEPLHVLPGDRFDDIVVTVSRRAWFQVDLGDRADFADAARLVDVRGETIALDLTRITHDGGVTTSTNATATVLPIVAGRSEVGSTAERECTCVLTKDGVEVARIPVRLGGTGVTIVRP